MLYRSLRNPAYRLRWKERFGFVQFPRNDHGLIWIHAVSVGEVRAAKPLVDALCKEYASYRIMITTMTPTGADTVLQLFGNAVTHRYVPYDLPGAVQRFIRTTRPSYLLIMETELWPNLFHYCQKNNVPVILVNGRMSVHAVRRYKIARPLAKSTLGCLSLIGVQNIRDAERFITLGACTNKIFVTGNLKFDIMLPEESLASFALTRQGWASVRPIWIAASTHSGEESAILQAHARILKEFPDCLLILAPRHPERAREVSGLCKKSGFSVTQKTVMSNPDESIQIYVLDTLGELINYYALSWLAFVGGSLVRGGGQNMLEPASLGIPVISGPHFFNFHEIGTLLQDAGAASIICNESELAQVVIKLFSDEKLRHDAGHNGRHIVLENKGSADRVMESLRPLLNQSATTLKKSV